MGIVNKQSKRKDLKIKTLTIKASDRLEILQLEDDDNDTLFSLGNKVIAGVPIVIGLQKMNPIQINKVLAFLSGVVFTIEGMYHTINERSYLFCDKTAFDDGSLTAWLKQLG